MTHVRDDAPVVIVQSSGGVGSFLVGVVLGAGLALLFAPQSGEETRQVLRRQGRRLREAAEEKADELQDHVEEGYERAKLRFEKGFEGARRDLGKKRTGVREAVDAGKAAVHSARDELERRLAKSRASRKKASAPDDDA